MKDAPVSPAPTDASVAGSQMEITAVVPLYNAAATVLRSLESIRAQTKPVTKIVVVDDHSTDGSPDLVRAAGIPNLEVMSTPRNGGPGAARNLGVRHADTEWVALLDSDDVWMPTFLEEVCAAIERFDADFGSSGGQRVKRYRGKSSIQKRLIDGPQEAMDLSAGFWRTAIRFLPIHSSSTVMRKSLFEKAGGFPEDVRNGEDVSLWMRLWLEGRFAFVNKPLFESVAISGGLSAGKLAYSDVRKGLVRMAVTLRDASGRRRPGTAWFAIWFAERIVRRHASWTVRKLRLGEYWARIRRPVSARP